MMEINRRFRSGDLFPSNSAHLCRYPFRFFIHNNIISISVWRRKIMDTLFIWFVVTRRKISIWSFSYIFRFIHCFINLIIITSDTFFIYTSTETIYFRAPSPHKTCTYWYYRQWPSSTLRQLVRYCFHDCFDRRWNQFENKCSVKSILCRYWEPQTSHGHLKSLWFKLFWYATTLHVLECQFSCNCYSVGIHYYYTTLYEYAHQLRQHLQFFLFNPNRSLRTCKS